MNKNIMNDENEKIRHSIKKVIEEINENPSIFRNETDIQARLYRYICDSLGEWDPIYEFEVKYRGVKEHFKTNRVHCEFYGGEKQRIDIGIFNKNDIENIEKLSYKKRALQNVLLSHAIEIKIETGESGDGYDKKPKNDMKKLSILAEKNRADNLFFLYIVRWPTKDEVKQKLIMKLVEELENYSEDVKFYSNDKKNYFLPYKNKTIKENR